MVKDVKQPILLVADEERIEEIITRLSRVGFDNTIGYLKGGFEAWIAERHAQIERGELVYITHQMDFLGQT